MNKWIYATSMMLMVSLSTLAQKRGGERPSAEDRAQRSTERMAKALTLTEDQKKQILGINLEYAKKNEEERKAAMQVRKAEMEAKKAEMKEQNSKVEAVLTQEQRAKWTEIKAEKIEDRRRGRPNAQIERDPRKRQ